MNDHDPGVPLEDFIQALASQLDRAQATMGVKARLGKLPLTFAVKDISLDLRTHVEMSGNAVHIRPAGPGEAEASLLHLSLTTITRPMIEENTFQLAAEPDEPPLSEVIGDSMSPEEQRRLEWAGIHTVAQLRDLEREGGERVVERVAQIPVLRLRQALERAAQPYISRVVPDRLGDDGGRLLRLRGQNLMGAQAPTVRIGGEPVPVLRAAPQEILVAPLAHQMSGTVEVETAPGTTAQAEFQVRG